MPSPAEFVPVTRKGKWIDWPFPTGRGVGNPGQQPGFAPLPGGSIPRTTLAKNATQGLSWSEHVHVCRLGTENEW